MGEKIIVFIVCILCSVPFYVVGALGKKSQTPISFFNGDNTLKDKVKDVDSYNTAMAKLYQLYSLIFLIAAILVWFIPSIAISILLFNSTAGIFVLYRRYKNILKKYEN